MIYFLATPLMLISGIPQIIKLLKRKRSDDISVLMFLFTWIAVVLLFIDSLQNGSLSLVWANGASLTTMSINLFLILKFRAKQPLIS